MTTEQNMATRLAKILGDVGRVEKKGQIRSQGSGPSYNFARDSDVLEAVNPKLAEAGCVLIPERVELLEQTQNIRGTQIIANIKTSWHVTDGKESLRFQTFGQGQDSGDKALPKAQSNARKYAFFMLFHIVTGDDPDQHSSEDQSRSGERASDSGGARSQPARTRSAAQPTNIGQAKGLLATVLAEHGMTFAQGEAKAKELGIDRGSASVDDILRLIAAIEQPDGERALLPSGDGAAPAARGGEGGSDLPAATETPLSEGIADSSASDAATGPVDSPRPPAPAPTLDDILAATGGELVPPRPGSAEYKALSAQEKVEARAWHQLNPDPYPDSVPA